MKRLLQLVFVALLAQGGAHAQTDVEYGIKAAYLARFGLFVDWPASAFSGPSSALVLCVAADDPFGDVLERSAAGQTIGDRPLLVRRVKAAVRDSGCHVLYLGGPYLGGPDSQRAAPAIDAVRGQPVLTVTDGARGAFVPGIVHFVVRDDRVRFEIDDAAAAVNGLQISSKLLGLALKVRARAQ